MANSVSTTISRETRFTNRIVVTVEKKTRRSSLFRFLQQNLSANDGNSSRAQSWGARRSA